MAGLGSAAAPGSKQAQMRHDEESEFLEAAAFAGSDSVGFELAPGLRAGPQSRSCFLRLNFFVLPRSKPGE